MKRLVLLILAIFLLLETRAQVGDVSSGSRANKERSKSPRSSDEDGGGSSDNAFFFFLEIFDVINLIGHSQGAQLRQRFDQPYRVSLEASVRGGYHNAEGTYLFLPSIRGNWGLFSTHLRSNRIQDRTGQYQTLDWQVIQLNLVNIPQFTLRTGAGFSYVKDIDDMYSEWTVELEGHIRDRTINPLLSFRWSNDFETEEVPRLEINPAIDYELFRTGKLSVNLMAGYRYQRYLGPEVGQYVAFHFMETGFNFYFY